MLEDRVTEAICRAAGNTPERTYIVESLARCFARAAIKEQEEMMPKMPMSKSTIEALRRHRKSREAAEKTSDKESLVEGIRELVRRADLATACGQHDVAGELLLQASEQVTLYLKIMTKEI